MCDCALVLTFVQFVFDRHALQPSSSVTPIPSSDEDAESAAVISSNPEASGGSKAEAIVEVPIASWNEQLKSSEPKSQLKRTGSRHNMSVLDALTKTMLPLVIFFLALQFHACLEAIVVGVQVCMRPRGSAMS